MTDLVTPVGMHECATCKRCATTYAIVHPSCPKCAERERLEAEIIRLRDGLREIANGGRHAFMYPDGRWRDMQEIARALLAENEGDGREPDGYRTEGGRVIPTDR